MRLGISLFEGEGFSPLPKKCEMGIEEGDTKGKHKGASPFIVAPLKGFIINIQ